MFSLRKFKTILSLFVCLLLIIPAPQPVKALIISQTAPKTKKEQYMEALYESQQYLTDLARDHGRRYVEIINNPYLRKSQQIAKLKEWRKNIFLDYEELVKSNNIYISAYFLATVYCQKISDGTGFPCTPWYDNLIYLESITIDMLTPTAGDARLSLKEKNKLYEKITVTTRYNNNRENKILI